jgi:hypothetical protein
MLPERKQNDVHVEELDTKLERTFSRMKEKLRREKEKERREMLTGFRSWNIKFWLHAKISQTLPRV